MPLHRNDIVRLSEPLAASQHLSDCVQVKFNSVNIHYNPVSAAKFEARSCDRPNNATGWVWQCLHEGNL